MWLSPKSTSISSLVSSNVILKILKTGDDWKRYIYFDQYLFKFHLYTPIFSDDDY